MIGVVLFASALAAGFAFAQPRGETVKVYAAAAVKTPLTHIIADYEKTSGNTIAVVYDTAGATEQKFRADPEAAILITTAPLIRNAESSGALKDGTTIFLGGTVAGVAVPPGTPKPDVSTPEKLKAALLSAKRVAFSDPARGATVEYVECYRRVRPRSDPAPLQRAWRSGEVHAFTVSSAEGLANLFTLLEPEMLRSLPLFVPHARVADAARRLGAREAIAAGPGDDEMLAGLVAYFQAR